MRIKLLMVLGIMFLLSSVQALAQTSDYHLRLGASPDRNKPPQEMDMSWASEESIALPEGQHIQLFVLWGDFGREGQWLSKFLPSSVRAGKEPAVMFEDNRWQSLRPVGIRHGLEIPFAMEMARRLDAQKIGVLVCNGSKEQLGALVAEAVAMAPTQTVAVIQLREHASDNISFGQDWAKRLDNQKILLIDMTPLIMLSPSNLDRSESIRTKGAAMAVHVLQLINQTKKEQ